MSPNVASTARARAESRTPATTLRRPRHGHENTVWEAWVEKGHTPARATVEARLASPRHLVEIMVEAAVG